MSSEERLSEIINLISIKGNITRKELAYELGVSRSTIARDLEKLKDMGKVEYEGSAKAGYWILKSN